jgi:hypothetical protein
MIQYNDYKIVYTPLIMTMHPPIKCSLEKKQPSNSRFIFPFQSIDTMDTTPLALPLEGRGMTSVRVQTLVQSGSHWMWQLWLPSRAQHGL